MPPARRFRGARVGEVVEPVVALVGERQTALVHHRDVARGVARVGLDEEGQEAAEAVALELADEVQESGHVGHGIDAGELVRQRRRPRLLDARGVQEAREQIADLAGLAARLGLLRLLHDGADVLLGLLGDEMEAAPSGFVVGDLGALQPAAVHVTEQVVLGADLVAQFFERETGAGGLGHAEQDKSPGSTRARWERGCHGLRHVSGAGRRLER